MISRAPVALAATERSVTDKGQRRWLVPMMAGIILALVFASAALGVVFGLFRPSEAPIASTVAPSAPPSAESPPTAPAPDTSPPVEPTASVPVTSVSATVDPMRSARPPVALRRFDPVRAASDIMRFTERMGPTCRSSQGPRVFAVTVTFDRGGRVRNIATDPLITASFSVLCATSQLRAMSTRPFDTPEVGVVSVSVGVE